jgi:hypothetical protein
LIHKATHKKKVVPANKKMVVIDEKNQSDDFLPVSLLSFSLHFTFE